VRNLKEARLKKGLTQKELAELIGKSKVSITHYENGQRDPSISDLKKLCKALDTSSDYLIGLLDEDIKKDMNNE
jgi:transcriptional regulator with XRE-family HTH domain